MKHLITLQHKATLLFFLMAAVQVSAARAAVIPTAVSAIQDSNGVVHFSLEFNDQPNFNTLDLFGRAKDAFQIYVDSARPVKVNRFRTLSDCMPLADCYPESKSIIRPPFEDAIRVVHLADESEPGNGGWGVTVAEVGYALDDRLVRFSIPRHFLSDQDNPFYYYFSTFSFGGTSYTSPESLILREGIVYHTDTLSPVFVSEPPAGPLFLFMLLWLSRRTVVQKFLRGVKTVSLAVQKCTKCLCVDPKCNA